MTNSITMYYYRQKAVDVAFKSQKKSNRYCIKDNYRNLEKKKFDDKYELNDQFLKHDKY